MSRKLRVSRSRFSSWPNVVSLMLNPILTACGMWYNLQLSCKISAMNVLTPTIGCGTIRHMETNEGMATRIGFEPTISAVTGRHVDHYTTGPLNPKGIEPPIVSAALEHGDSENRSLLFARADGVEHAIASPALAIRDGCGCARDVIRCVHFNGSVVRFTDNSLHANPCPNCDACGYWARWQTSKDGDDCSYGAKGLYVGHSEADALAAFYAAEEALRQDPAAPEAAAQGHNENAETGCTPVTARREVYASEQSERN